MDELERKKQELLAAEANVLHWQQRVAFQRQERQRLAAEIEAQEILQEQLNAELARAQDAVRKWLEQAPPEELGTPN